MFYRVVAATASVLALAGCQQSGPALGSTNSLTAPSSLSMKAVDVPFSGVVTGEAAFDFATNPKGCASGFTTITTASGTASHMGRTAWQSQHCVGVSDITNGGLVLTAANGDQINVNYTGSCSSPEAPVIGQTFTCSGTSVVSGGTGRFEHASGAADWNATIVFEGFEDFSWPGQWEWHGTIRY